MDLAAYLRRIGLNAAPLRTAAGLAALQRAHRLAIGFENLDVMLGRALPIDGDAVFAKIVGRSRGGYCFEQNRLYGDALGAMGLAVRPFLARVRLGVEPGVTPPRGHVGLLAHVEGEDWLADAGFGGSDLPPLLLHDGAEAQTGDGARHRLRRIGEAGTLGGQWLLERAGPAAATDGRAAQHGDWQPQYTFDLAEVAPGDLEQANHWAATRPGTRFTTLHIASLATPQGFASMRDREVTIYDAGSVQQRRVETPSDYVRELRETFRIVMTEEEAASLPLFA